jgi:hypothetical protein
MKGAASRRASCNFRGHGEDLQGSSLPLRGDRVLRGKASDGSCKVSLRQDSWEAWMKRRDRQGRREAQELNALTKAIIGAAIKVHRELGPGLLESAYEACLCFELRRQG